MEKDYGERGCLLSFILALLLAINILGMFSFIFNYLSIKLDKVGIFTNIEGIVYSLTAIINIIAIIGVYSWKKWGAYILFIISIFLFIFPLYMDGIEIFAIVGNGVYTIMCLAILINTINTLK
ncbi:hypothetical protein [Desnuesiella massiliensis]|uniref:hypothetical protein n=1 Tax=Desnuesiella massiliensis TaxID=1650662 RepID=UPI0006E2559E|nr:hypothetical protein [Desnuesiella massiliensis]